MKILKNILIVTLISVFLLSGFVSAEENINKGGMMRIIGQWGSLTNNFNPFLASGQNAPGTRSAVYETLLFVSVLDGSETPILATSYEWSEDNLTLSMKLREGVKWNDGEPFNAEDVVFTFNFMKEYPALDLGGIWSNSLSEVKSINEYEVEFIFSQQNVPIFRPLVHTYIVPQHIWSDIENPTTFTNPNPVATGPFMKSDFSPQVAIYQRNPEYWMENKPYLDQVAYQGVKSNDTALLMMRRHEADYSHLFVPDVENAWGAQSEENNFWWPVTNSNILYMNNQEEPFSDPAFRKALARIIDKDKLSEKALYNVLSGAHPTGIIPGQQSQWLDESLSEFSYEFNPEEAKEILTEAGYSWDDQGKLLNPEGEEVEAFNILVGAGWTDFISMAQLISDSARELGLEVMIEQEPWNSYINSLMGGTFQTAISWGTGTGSNPYELYYRTLDSRFSGKDGGQAESNYGRFRNEVVDEALTEFRSNSDIEIQKEAISTIQEIVLKEVPFIPLTDRANNNIYQESTLVNWPTAEDPYSGGDPGDEIGARSMLLNVHQK